MKKNEWKSTEIWKAKRKRLWSPRRAVDQDTRASPNRLETHLVREWGDIGHQLDVGPRIYNKKNSTAFGQQTSRIDTKSVPVLVRGETKVRLCDRNHIIIQKCSKVYVTIKFSWPFARGDKQIINKRRDCRIGLRYEGEVDVGMRARKAIRL